MSCELFERVKKLLARKFSILIQLSFIGNGNLQCQVRRLRLSSAFESFTRTVLVLLDRNMDLAILMHHTWIYQALIDVSFCLRSLGKVMIWNRLIGFGLNGRGVVCLKLLKLHKKNSISTGEWLSKKLW